MSLKYQSNTMSFWQQWPASMYHFPLELSTVFFPPYSVCRCSGVLLFFCSLALFRIGSVQGNAIMFSMPICDPIVTAQLPTETQKTRLCIFKVLGEKTYCIVPQHQMHLANSRWTLYRTEPILIFVIWEQYWSIHFVEQHMFHCSYVPMLPVERRIDRLNTIQHFKTQTKKEVCPLDLNVDFNALNNELT